MGDHADDAIFAGIGSSWGWRRHTTKIPPRQRSALPSEFAHLVPTPDREPIENNSEKGVAS